MDSFEGIVEALLEQMRTGELKPGDQLGSEAELVERFGCSRGTVRRALGRLDWLGLVEPRAGKGWFVCLPRTERVDRIEQIEEALEQAQQALDRARRGIQALKVG